MVKTQFSFDKDDCNKYVTLAPKSILLKVELLDELPN